MSEHMIGLTILSNCQNLQLAPLINGQNILDERPMQTMELLFNKTEKHSPVKFQRFYHIQKLEIYSSW